MKEYIRWDGWRIKHKGQAQGDVFVSYGYLCGRNSHSFMDKRVKIFHTPGIGYTYESAM